MAKYHIKENGEPGLCKASKKPCPVGGVNEHYSSPEKARAAYEKSQAQRFSMTERLNRIHPNDNSDLAKIIINSEEDYDYFYDNAQITDLNLYRDMYEERTDVKETLGESAINRKFVLDLNLVTLDGKDLYVVFHDDGYEGDWEDFRNRMNIFQNYNDAAKHLNETAELWNDEINTDIFTRAKLSPDNAIPERKNKFDFFYT